ncbi:hypothetical protein K8I31_01310, partial [bacterium]|nr:hypothetical protein [bacterium]
CGTWVGLKVARVQNAKPATYWMAFLPQAGLSLGLAGVLEKEGYVWAPPVVTLLIACIAINEIIGPILMKYALQQTGECPQPSEGRNASSASAPAHS